MLSLAQTYATLINEGRFEELTPLLSEDCHYRYSEGNYLWRDNIVSLFRHNHEMAKRTFEETHYSSSASPVDENTFKVLLLDQFRFRGEWGEHPNKQILKIANGLIVDIEEFETVGQISPQNPS